MSKLFKLKEWLTVEEAAKHLSTVLGEEVAIADIYRLALDGHLVMSMSFPNHAYGNLGEVVGIQNTKRFTPPPLMLNSMREFEPNYAPEEIVISDYIGNEQFINWSEKVTGINGVWDLAMLASERIDVEFVYQQLIGGPEVELTNIDGTFLRRGDIFCRLVESWDDNEYKKGSLAQKRQLEGWVARGEVSKENIAPMWEKFEANRREYLQEKKAAPFEKDFYPAGGLPKDGVYVVRTSAIMDFLTAIEDQPVKQDKALSTKERNSMLTLIAALCKEAKIDPKQRGISTALAASTEIIGKSLTDDTIRGILKQVTALFD